MARTRTTQRPTAYRYQPDGSMWIPGMRPGDTVTPRDENHRAELERLSCFTPVRNEPEPPTEEGTEEGRTGGGGES